MSSSSSAKIRKIQRHRMRREIFTALGFAVLAAIAYCALLGQGPLKLTPLEVIDVLTGGGDRREITVVWELRLPVALATLIVGAALGAAGSWTQIMARNPLASPDILGVSGGAAAFVVFGTVLARPEIAEDLTKFWYRAALALVGATFAIILLVVLAGFGVSQRVVLVGLALSLMSSALIYYVMARANMHRAAEAQTWLSGSTAFVRMDAILPMLLGLVPFLFIGIFAHRRITLLSHDDESATTLGVNVKRTRAEVLCAATGVVAVVVSVVGPIGFIALMAPQVSRIVSGSPVPSPMSGAAAGAALLTVCANIAALLPMSAPVGLVTAIVGGPVLVWLVWRSVREAK
ncbi:iron ABC transporter permease [Corynebacterium sp. TAE3-ERU12]|uniref:FecCD family ABC transporter permease n=1 Tax=Corynebacterium sp. TAE3-ERU12 TaxID=2849491 RepID=UPI001C474DA6|nr:iron ABC transporter permease [Corynebacterium sp. TAE3-ERU12]MBV7294622.1 iron ABC transporter permease [Corynebacterium sp. TAE3-ERU12]